MTQRQIALNLNKDNQTVASIVFDVHETITPIALKNYIYPVVREYLHSVDAEGVCDAWKGTITFGDLLDVHIPEVYWRKYFMLPRYGLVTAPESIDVDFNEIIIKNLPTKGYAKTLVVDYLKDLQKLEPDILPGDNWTDYAEDIVRMCHDFYDQKELFRAATLAMGGSFDFDENEPTGLPYPDDCPLGGDTMCDCADCPYAGEYHYDFISGYCVLRD